MITAERRVTFSQLGVFGKEEGEEEKENGGEGGEQGSYDVCVGIFCF